MTPFAARLSSRRMRALTSSARKVCFVCARQLVLLMLLTFGIPRRRRKWSRQKFFQDVKQCNHCEEDVSQDKRRGNKYTQLRATP
jgi:hypothetical protein